VKVNYAANNDNDAAVKAAKESDVAIVFVGNHPTCDARVGQSARRPATARRPWTAWIDLEQEALVKQVYAANPKTVVVLVSSFPFAINWTQQNVPAILHITHNAQEEGTAIAEVLFGDYNPGGRLVQTLAEVARPGSGQDGLRYPPRPHLHVFQGRSAVSLRLRA
jgi:beta-glucosidase